MALPGVYKIFNERWAGQTVWVISDTHFNDQELRAGHPIRPSDEELVKIINSKVGRKDTLIHLGDVGDIEWMRQVRGYKVLIVGNHDAGISNYEGVFDEVYSGPLMIGEKFLLSHEPISLPWVLNIHGHDHAGKQYRKNCINVNLDATKYTPLNLNQFLKSGPASKIESIHRQTIDKATERKRKRGGKKIYEQKK